MMGGWRRPMTLGAICANLAAIQFLRGRSWASPSRSRRRERWALGAVAGPKSVAAVARAAGSRPAADERELLSGADYFLSILPPDQAEALASRLAPALQSLA